MHPEVLLEQLTARQLFDWWILWHDEPWGDKRQDFRTWAHAGLMFGMQSLTPEWPYFPRDWTLEEIAEEIARIEGAIEDVNRRKNLDRD